MYRDTLRRVDGKSGKLEYKLEKGPSGAALQDSIVTWRINNVGDAPFTVSAIDNETGLQFVFTWTVHADYENFPPQIRDMAAAMPAFGVVGWRYADTLSVSDFNADVPILRNPENHPWITFQDSLFFIRPGPADTGTHHVSIIAEDGKGGSDTLAWILRISKDDAEICGFRNVKVGTSWVYHGTSPYNFNSMFSDYYDSLRIQSESRHGDTSGYAMAKTMRSAGYGDLNSSFRLTIAGEAVRTWGSTGEVVYEEKPFTLDCGKEYEVSKAAVLGDSAWVLKRILSRDSLGNPHNQEIWAMGVGLVYSYVSSQGTTRYPMQDTYSLVRFNERKVLIRSLDPLDLAYE